MADTAQFAQQVRFGAFEVDLRAGELWKAGRKRKLTGQPFLVLAILLEHPGEVVSREELQQRLWPDTFVDVDHNLNAAVNKIREALGDSAEHPRFVETLPRRGYRFIASVETAQPARPQVAERKPPNSEAELASDLNGPGGISAVSASAPHAPIPRKKSKLWLWLVAAVVVLVVAYLLRSALPPPEVTGVTQLTQDGTIKLPEAKGPPAPLATDESRIYFEERSGSERRLMQVSTDGG